MAADVKTLKEYLVKLGFDVNENQFKEFMDVLDLSETEMANFAGMANVQMLSATFAVLSFVSSANAGIASYLGSLARAELDTELFARRMWVSVEQGKAIQTALEATGHSIEDLWYSDELRDQFRELQELAMDIEPPEDYREYMQSIREVQFEFTKLRVTFAYVSQWVGFYLTKFLEEPIKNIKGDIEDINEFVNQNIPNISQKIARFLSNFVRVGQTITWIIKGIATGLIEMPEQIRQVSLALAALFAAASANPFTLAIAGVSLLLLMLEDYYTFTQGGKSAFEDLWKSIQASTEIQELRENFSGVVDETADLIDNVSELIEKLSDITGIDFGTIADVLGSLAEDTLSELNAALDVTVFLLERINDLIELMTESIDLDITGGFLDGVEEKFDVDLSGIKEFFGYFDEEQTIGINFDSEEVKVDVDGTGVEKIVKTLSNISDLELNIKDTEYTLGVDYSKIKEAIEYLGGQEFLGFKLEDVDGTFNIKFPDLKELFNVGDVTSILPPDLNIPNFELIRQLIEGYSAVQTTNQSSVTYNVEQKFENTNNIQGSDPYAIGKQVDNNFNDFGNLMRSVQGPFGR